jgi:hypothetical protein
MKRSAAQNALGAKAFAAITAVEGLKLSTESKKRLIILKTNGLTHDQQRLEILRTYKVAR